MTAGPPVLQRPGSGRLSAHADHCLDYVNSVHMDDGARIAVRTVREAATPPVAEVRFVLCDEDAYAHFQAALAAEG
ncbi:hypothetical protein QFZ82_001816 [Streptomyces sp. V4I23]|nr:hypothetical protein [Streptomyces sp. V4I23]